MVVDQRQTEKNGKLQTQHTWYMKSYTHDTHMSNYQYNKHVSKERYIPDDK